MVKSFLSSEYEVFVEQCAIFTLQTPICIIWLTRWRGIPVYMCEWYEKYDDMNWQNWNCLWAWHKKFPIAKSESTFNTMKCEEYEQEKSSHAMKWECE